MYPLPVPKILNRGIPIIYGTYMWSESWISDSCCIPKFLQYVFDIIMYILSIYLYRVTNIQYIFRPPGIEVGTPVEKRSSRGLCLFKKFPRVLFEIRYFWWPPWWPLYPFALCFRIRFTASPISEIVFHTLQAFLKLAYWIFLHTENIFRSWYLNVYLDFKPLHPN